ncbi:MAG: DUF134 domain-containing protein [Clostridiales bacterium]|nr:DUF134 domain-containing protein [Clostridiales bacterium]
MPRKPKGRKVCRLPIEREFSPKNAKQMAVIVKVEEYETLRLIDKEGFSQEQCSEFMGVARTTVQYLYADARRKVATALVEGRPLRIEGGTYSLCDGTESSCLCGGCEKHKKRIIIKKGDIKMRIAVTYENENIFGHFGHTENFKIYDVSETSKIVKAAVVSTNGQGHGALSSFLKELQVDVLICGGIGGGAQMALAEAGIKVFGGCTGSCDDAVNNYLSGSLNYNPDVRCSHHDHEHGEGHTCGSHGCGSGHCGNH